MTTKRVDFDSLTLYYCGGCGTVSVDNHRDDCCPVCKVCMDWREIRLKYQDHQIEVEDYGEAWSKSQ